MSRNGSLPKGWRHVRLSDVATVNEAVLPASTPTDAEIAYLDIASIRETGQIDQPVTLRMSEAPSRARRCVRSGDILVSTVRPYLRAFARVEDAPKNLVASTGFAVVSPRAGVDPDLVYQQILSTQFVEYLVPRMTGTNYPAVSAESVAAFEFLLAPAAEQQAIARTLSALDETIERTETVIARVAEAKQALAHELLVRGLPGRHARFKHTAAGEIPEDWEVVELADCGRWMSGGTPTRDRADYWNGVIPWISGKDMKTQRLTDSEEHITQEAVGAGATVMEPGTVLIVVRGMILAHTMPIAVLERPAAFNQDLKALQCRGDINPYFALHALADRSRALLDLVDEATHGTKRLASERLMAVVLPVPPIDEQETIVRAVEEVDARTQSESVELERLRETKERVAGALLSGDIRVGRKKEKAHGKT